MKPTCPRSLRFRIVPALAAVLLLGLSAPVLASDMPYYSYTYDQWGRPVESPSGYEPVEFFGGLDLGVGSLSGPTDLFVAGDGRLYILDAGNGRVIIVPPDRQDPVVVDRFTLVGVENALNAPEGLFVTPDGLIYIADTGNERVVVTDETGAIRRTFRKPGTTGPAGSDGGDGDTGVFPPEAAFAPQKLVVDRMGTLYIVCKGIGQGAVLYSRDGDFLGFFGGNKVEVTAGLLLDRFWKSILSQEARDKLSRYIPVEYSSIAIDGESFVYSCTVNSGSTLNMIRKINPMGINILETRATRSFQGGFGDLQPVWYNNTLVRTQFIDLCVGDDGLITALDSTRGRLFQYDQDANLLFAYGGLGAQLGMFRNPVAVDALGRDILVLDKAGAGITRLTPTEFGRRVHTAMALYNDGRYQEAVEPWNQVLKYDSHFNLAYIGIGKALLETGQPRAAMESFRIGHDPDGYDLAYAEYRTDTLRRNFLWYFLAAVLAIAYGYGRNIPVVRRWERRVLSAVGSRLRRHRPGKGGGAA